MLRKHFALACVLLLGACSDNPEAPPVEKATAYQFPKVAQSPSPFAAPSPLVTTGPRVEIYSNGVLKQVLSGSGGNTTPLPASVADVAFPPNFGALLDGLERHPLNKRTAHFVNVLRVVANAPAAARGKALEAVSKQLLRETEHKDITLPDGSRVLEYYFDHELRTRVVLAPRPVASQRRHTDLSMPIETPVAGETVTDGTDCTVVDCGYDPAYDAMLWATVTWYADQLQEMVDIASVEGDASGPYVITYEKMCLSPILAWTGSVFVTAGIISTMQEGWPTWKQAQKITGIGALSTAFGALVTSWNAMHNCFHP